MSDLLPWSQFNGWAVEFGSSEAHRITANVVDEPALAGGKYPPSGQGWEKHPEWEGWWINPLRMRPKNRPRTACGRIFRVSHGEQRGTLQYSPEGPEPACPDCRKAVAP